MPIKTHADDNLQATCKTFLAMAFTRSSPIYAESHFWNFAFFVFPHSFNEDYAVQVFFLHPILNEVCSERKQDFTLTVSLSLY